jgi:alpha-N-arabinofuranosidase
VYVKRLILTAAALVAAVSPTPALAQAQPATEATVSISTATTGPRIDRNIYGQFAEHLGRGIYEGIWVGQGSRIPNIKGYRTDVLEALKHIHVPVVRWPGGCFSEVYDWRDGIGPRNKRPVRTRMNWDDVTDSNQFGTHEFLEFAELLGAAPYVSGNVGSMSPRDMQLWLEYMTADNDSALARERRRNGRAKPWTIRYFGIGNETWGCGGNMRPDYAADVNARYSAFAKAPEAMNMVRVASGASVQGGGDYEAFTEAMMKQRGETEALSFHYYAMPMDRPKSEALGFTEAEWADCWTWHARWIPCSPASRRSWTGTIPTKKCRSLSTSGAPGISSTRRPSRGSIMSSRTACAMASLPR